jgi:hypothetical protein
MSDWDEFRWIVGNYVSLATEEFKRRREEARLKVFEDNISAHIDAFQDRIIASASINAISSGFDQLDFQLDVGFYEGFYIVEAITSLWSAAKEKQETLELSGRYWPGSDMEITPKRKKNLSNQRWGGRVPAIWRKYFYK